MTRRTHIALLTSAAATVSPVFGKDNTVLIAILQASQNEKKGVSLYLRGQTLAGIVVVLSIASAHAVGALPGSAGSLPVLFNLAGHFVTAWALATALR